MLNDIYSRRILELAADIPCLGRLAEPDASATARSKLCGSTVTVDVKLDGNVVTAFAHDVRACALGQASSSIMARNIIGATIDELRDVRDVASRLLKANGATVSTPLSAIERRTSAHRPAPNAARTAKSRDAIADRARSRLAIFAHAMSNTSTTALNRIQRVDPMLPTTCSCAGTSDTPHPAFESGCSRAISPAILDNSARA